MATISYKGKRSISSLGGGLNFEHDKNRIIGRDESGVPDMIIVRNPGEAPIFRIAKSGYNVFEASDDQLIFNSENNLFKIVDSGTLTLTSPNLAGSSNFVNVPHTLGYNPTILAYVSFSPTGTAYPMPYFGIEPVSPTPGIVNYEVSFEAVGGNLITFFWVDIARATSLTAYIRYYIIQETSAYS